MYTVIQNDLVSPRALIDIATPMSGKLSERSQHRFVASLADFDIVLLSNMCYFEQIAFLTRELRHVLQGVGQLMIVEQVRIVRQFTNHEAPLDAALIRVKSQDLAR